MDSYYSLRKYLLENNNKELVNLKIVEIEKILGKKLPPSAFIHSAWWSNSFSHSHAKAWLESGWIVKKPGDVIKNREVVFVRYINPSYKNDKAKGNVLPYEVYERQYQFLSNIVLDNQENFEKTILTLSASFLAFSISFLGLFDIKVFSQINYLFISWGCFFTSVLLILINFKFSEFSTTKDINRITNLMEGLNVDKDNNHWVNIVEYFYLAAGFFFIVGILLLMVFCGNQYMSLKGG